MSVIVTGKPKPIAAAKPTKAEATEKKSTKKKKTGGE